MTANPRLAKYRSSWPGHGMGREDSSRSYLDFDSCESAKRRRTIREGALSETLLGLCHSH